MRTAQAPLFRPGRHGLAAAAWPCCTGGLFAWLCALFACGLSRMILNLLPIELVSRGEETFVHCPCERRGRKVLGRVAWKSIYVVNACGLVGIYTRKCV